MQQYKLIFEDFSIGERIKIEESINNSAKALREFATILEYSVLTEAEPMFYSGTLPNTKTRTAEPTADKPKRSGTKKSTRLHSPGKGHVNYKQKYNLTNDEVDQLFAAIEKAGGRTVVGHSVDAVAKAGGALKNLGAMLMSSKIVQGFDEKFDQLMQKIKNLLENGEFTTLNYNSDRDGESSSLIVRTIRNYRDFAKKHPYLQAFFIGLLMAIVAALSGGGAGLPLILGAIKTTDKLLQGAKLSRALATGAVYAAAGWAVRELADLIAVKFFPIEKIEPHVILNNTSYEIKDMFPPGTIRKTYEAMFAASREHGDKAFVYTMDGKTYVSGTLLKGETPYTPQQVAEFIKQAKMGKLVNFGDIMARAKDMGLAKAAISPVNAPISENSKFNRLQIITESNKHRIVVTENRSYVDLTESEVDQVFEGFMDWFRKKDEPISLNLNQPAAAVAAPKAAAKSAPSPAPAPAPAKPSFMQRAKSAVSKVGSALTNKITKNELHKAWRQYKQENNIPDNQNSSDVLYAMLAAYKPETLNALTIQDVYKQLGLPKPNMYGADNSSQLHSRETGQFLKYNYEENQDLDRIRELAGLKRL